MSRYQHEVPSSCKTTVYLSIVNEFSTEDKKYESKCIIVNKCYTEEEKSEFVINKQKDSKNETDYEESSVTYAVTSYFNVLKCRRKILNRIDVSYERACMATPGEKYYTKMLETIIEHNDSHNAPLSSEKL